MTIIIPYAGNNRKEGGGLGVQDVGPGKEGLSMEADLKLEIAEQGPKAAAVLDEERGRVVMTVSGPR